MADVAVDEGRLQRKLLSRLEIPGDATTTVGEAVGLHVHHHIDVSGQGGLALTNHVAGLHEGVVLRMPDDRAERKGGAEGARDPAVGEQGARQPGTPGVVAVTKAVHLVAMSVDGDGTGDGAGG